MTRRREVYLQGPVHSMSFTRLFLALFLRRVVTRLTLTYRTSRFWLGSVQGWSHHRFMVLIQKAPQKGWWAILRPLSASVNVSSSVLTLTLCFQFFLHWSRLSFYFALDNVLVTLHLLNPSLCLCNYVHCKTILLFIK